MARTTPTSGVAITARQLRRQFGGAAVLRDLDLHVPAGQFLTVVGRSGSGKSTLLRLLAGLDRPDGGRVMSAAAAEARIMFQEPRLLPWASVLDNVAVGLGPAPGQDGASRAQRTLEEVGLGDRSGDWPATLSGGQRQRVALARALISRPRFLVFDEPLGALDALTRIEMQALVERAWLEGGFTAVMVTHDVTEAIALGDRVVLLESGVIALDLPVDLPRPRRRGSPEFARLEQYLLDRLLGSRDDAAEAA